MDEEALLYQLGNEYSVTCMECGEAVLSVSEALKIGGRWVCGLCYDQGGGE